MITDDALRELTDLADHAEAFKQQRLGARDEAIRRALAEGMTQRHVAEATGLSPGRIGQIATRKDAR